MAVEGGQVREARPEGSPLRLPGSCVMLAKALTLSKPLKPRLAGGLGSYR